MTPEESKEVLTNPTRGLLDFDPQVLEEAYSLTGGQPLLLQMLGSTLIRHFNEAHFAGRERGNYVDLGDLNRAAQILTSDEGNAAFENHWSDLGPGEHRLLSALAWATSGTTTRKLSPDGIEAAMKEVGLAIPSKKIYPIPERLREEEVLTLGDITYRFAVPLYRRWVEWWHKPERVRFEGDGED